MLSKTYVSVTLKWSHLLSVQFIASLRVKFMQSSNHTEENRKFRVAQPNYFALTRQECTSARCMFNMPNVFLTRIHQLLVITSNGLTFPNENTTKVKVVFTNNQHYVLHSVRQRSLIAKCRECISGTANINP